MTAIYFTLCSLPKRDDGLVPIHMYVGYSESTRTDSPGDERRALKDAKQIIIDLLTKECGEDYPDDQLLQEGAPPQNAMPIFTFAIGVSWSREHMLPHYSQIDYKRIVSAKMYSEVYTTGMELLNEMMTTLKKREKIDCKANGVVGKLRDDPISKTAICENFTKYTNTMLSRWVHGVKVMEANEKRKTCPYKINGFCSPSDGTTSHLKCMCFNKGNCIIAE